MALTDEAQKFTKYMSQEDVFDSIDDRLDFLRECALYMYKDAHKRPNKLLSSSQFSTLAIKDKVLIIKEAIDLLAKETGVTLSNIKTV